jgi:hypothetical protein
MLRPLGEIRLASSTEAVILRGYLAFFEKGLLSERCEALAGKKK